ncbi:hypothetical protein [Anaeromicropila herbilytica]|uniref:Uncharacterized protein n=1 Tax=Anaeromicropila herbilytica TaxID=2785025 RepID=A0A7R7EQD0_9FIRM|nr:hypothetical protein [Anaeromicropila herbilytica]BCN32825.1 hypothetical protein bsdtb5_41200 [Anaeromicropila herbilytica]
MRKKPFLMNKERNLLEKNKKIIIGVIGTHRGVGVTHLCVMLSNYLSEVMGKRTAVLECNTHNDFSYIQMVYEGMAHKAINGKAFQVYDTSYYKNVTQKEIADILNNNFDYIIMDLGTDRDNEEFLRCNCKLVVSSLCDWKRHELIKFLHYAETMNGYLEWEYLVLYGDKSDLKEIKHNWNIHLNLIPFETDPFQVSKEVLNLFQKFS